MRKAESKRSVRLRVQELAAQKHLSDLELAHLAQVDVRVVRKMLANQRVGEITLSQLVRVAEALNVPICELIEEQTKETKDGNSDK
jgi:transcriptional regulator with XRE-family HTH domain